MAKTSLTHPLRIAAVPVPGTPGAIGMTLCPGRVEARGLPGDWRRDLETDLGVIRDWGACALVTLMEAHELKDCQVADLPKRAAAGLTHFWLPIPDGGVPDVVWEQRWEQAGADLRALLAGGGKVAIHCLGGLGRTGTISARLLVEFGMGAEQAMAAVREARPGAIETAAQEDYVRRQGPVGTAGGRPRHPIAPERASRFRGCLVGGAVGDALGAPVEFMDLEAIFRSFGPGGIRNLVPAYGRQGAITDDTQMTLFTAEGVLRWHVRGGGQGPDLPGLLAHAYQRWLRTQGTPGRARGVGTDGWLFTHRDLFSRRAPGNTCIGALSALEGVGDGRPANNSSKGCGGVMRVAPLGLYTAARGLPAEAAFAWGCQAAAVTHGHPTGQLPAGAAAMLIGLLAGGQGLDQALEETLEVLRRQAQCRETLEALEAARELAAAGGATGAALARLGQGWVAEEALAIAVFCALRAHSLEEGVVMAVNRTGDSDSTGAIAGNLLGAMMGFHEIPERWLAPLELREVLVEVADDLAAVDAWILTESGPGKDREEKEYWQRRYPGW